MQAARRVDAALARTSYPRRERSRRPVAGQALVRQARITGHQSGKGPDRGGALPRDGGERTKRGGPVACATSVRRAVFPDAGRRLAHHGAGGEVRQWVRRDRSQLGPRIRGRLWSARGGGAVATGQGGEAR